MSEPKNHGRKLNASFKYVFLPAVAAMFLIASCEPNDWDLIISEPGPVENLTEDHTGGTDTIQFDFTLPNLPVAEIFPDYSLDVLFYYRKTVDTEETHFGIEYYDKPQLGTPQTVVKDLASEGLSIGTDYVFILYTVDAEYQKSIGVVSTVITW